MSEFPENPDTAMRVERTNNPQFHKCWLTTDEYEQLRRTTNSYRDELGGGAE